MEQTNDNKTYIFNTQKEVVDLRARVNQLERDIRILMKFYKPITPDKYASLDA